MEPAAMIEALVGCAEAIDHAVAKVTDWRAKGDRPGQYRIDIAADEVGVNYLTDRGFAVLSEESGVHCVDRELFAVIDPIDGSTNASRNLPWYATSICVLDGEGPLAALVINQASKVRYQAVRGGGAFRDGTRISPSPTEQLSRAIVGLSGYPEQYLGWSQYRALGAIALDLCAVAEGSLDAYLDCGRNSHGPWDYLAGMFICQEAGAIVIDVDGRELVTRDYEGRRSPVAAGTEVLAQELQSAFLRVVKS
ncbi:MAG TPA: inositol monophosphatase family protein [Acidimicrobiales bacterium]|nr:inositol monophosphatase family protein [Acidimicrobiales bacterium]